MLFCTFAHCAESTSDAWLQGDFGEADAEPPAEEAKPAAQEKPSAPAEKQKEEAKPAAASPPPPSKESKPAAPPPKVERDALCHPCLRRKGLCMHSPVPLACNDRLTCTQDAAAAPMPPPSVGKGDRPERCAPS